ncbi:MAG: hypothetical protein MJE77_12455 [Proteobacteria bacterium]|nr:hypothetical protein [Pseudomonadota bacterium]
MNPSSVKKARRHCSRPTPPQLLEPSAPVAVTVLSAAVQLTNRGDLLRLTAVQNSLELGIMSLMLESVGAASSPILCVCRGINPAKVFIVQSA